MQKMNLTRRRILTLSGLLSSGGCQRASSQSNLSISAASSLQKPLRVLDIAFTRSNPTFTLTFNFGSSGSLARQIVEGAPADVFLSAAAEPMDNLAAKGLLLGDTRSNLLQNQLVLVAPKENVALTGFAGLADKRIRLIALGDPGSVPAGTYGKQALQALGLWEAIEPKLVLAKDVRQVLSYVETGNADAGLVYSTDAQSSQNVRIVSTAPPSSHQPITYPVAILKESQHQQAARTFLRFLASSEAADVFRQNGFQVAAP